MKRLLVISLVLFGLQANIFAEDRGSLKRAATSQHGPGRGDGDDSDGDEEQDKKARRTSDTPETPSDESDGEEESTHAGGNPDACGLELLASAIPHIPPTVSIKPETPFSKFRSIQHPTPADYQALFTAEPRILLHIAAEKANQKVIGVLFKKFWDHCTKGETPEEKKVELFAYLNHETPGYMRAIEKAILGKKLPELLAAVEAQVTALADSETARQTVLSCLTTPRSNGKTVLHFAAQKGTLGDILCILKTVWDYTRGEPEAKNATRLAFLNHEDAKQLRAIEHAMYFKKMPEFLAAVKSQYSEVAGKITSELDVLSCLRTPRSNGQTLLQYTAKEGRKEDIQCIIQNVWEYTKDGFTHNTAVKKANLLGFLNYENTLQSRAIEHAIAGKKLPVFLAAVEEVVTTLANPEAGRQAVLSCLTTPNSKGCTALHSAIHRGTQEDVQLILQKLWGCLDGNLADKKKALLIFLKDNRETDTYMDVAIENDKIEEFFAAIKSVHPTIGTEIIRSCLDLTNTEGCTPLRYAHRNNKTAASATILKTIIDITPGGVLDKMAALNAYVTASKLDEPVAPAAGPVGSASAAQEAPAPTTASAAAHAPETGDHDAPAESTTTED